MSPPRPPAARTASRRPDVVVLALSIATGAGSMQQSAVLPLLSRLQTSLHTTLTGATWAFTASLLCGAVATPLVSRFGTMYGRRRLLLITLGLLLVGSIAGALSTDLPTFIVARVLQGTSVAVLPLAIGAVRELLPPDRTAGGIGVLSATMGTGVGLGFLISGLVAHYTSGYRAVFWISTAAALAAMVLVALVVHDITPPVGGKPDILGAVLLAAPMVCLLLAISQGRSWGWASMPVLGLMAASAVLGTAWVIVERRADDPLIAIGLVAHPATVGASLISMLLSFALFSGFTLLPNFVETPTTTGYGFGTSVLQAAFYLLPTSLLMLLLSLLVGRILRRISAAAVVASGAAIATLPNLWLLVRHDAPSDIYVATTLLGLGIGLAFPALGTLAIEHVRPTETAVASAVNSIARFVGGSIAGAVSGAILSADSAKGSGLPTEHAYEVMFAIAACCVAAAAVIASFTRATGQGTAARQGSANG
ncbi:MFS transporter [Streptomyces samsunensis]|uniref:MFS transporter n=1 Tax=Streptomyces malaysiensis subsp. samsunensis TaxID=459658 RepID=A0A9X2M5U8_STRMQ|nr:MFS transporter [Streptomyces samsunensis]